MADIAALVFDIDSADALRAAGNLEKMSAAATKMSSSAKNAAAEADRLASKFSTGYSTLKKFKDEFSDIDKAFNSNLISGQKYTSLIARMDAAQDIAISSGISFESALRRVDQGLSDASSGANRYKTSMQGVNNVQSSVGNQFSQLNDVVVSSWGGMNPALIGMQQGMQMVQGFAGQSMPQALATMKGAFAQLLSPMTLATVAAIAVAAAIIQYGSSFLTSAKDAKVFEDAISSAEDAIGKINKATQILGSAGLEDLGKKYGVVNEQVRALVESQRLLAISDGTVALKTAIDNIAATLGQGLFNDVTSDLANIFKTTALNANELRLEIEGIGRLKTLEEQVAAMEAIRNRLFDVTNGFKDLSPEQAKMLKSLIDAQDKATELLAVSNRLPQAFNAAASAASRITDELNRAINAASRLASAGISDVRRAQIELDFRKDPIRKAGALAAAEFDAEVGKDNLSLRWVDAQRRIAVEGAKETARIMAEVEALNKADTDASRKTKSGAGKAAAELKAAEKSFQTIRELLEKESVFQIAEWEKRQAQLDQALAKNLLSETTYQTMKQQLQMVYFGAEFEQKAVQYAMDQEQLQTALDGKLLTEQQYMMKRSELQHKYYSDAIGIDQNGTSQQLSQMSADFAQMNSLAGGGYDGLLKAQKAFAAGSALINAYLAASQAMADPSVPYWMKIAAYAKVLAAGMGAVNAIKGGGSGGASAGSTSTASPTKQEPTKNIMVRLEGPDYMVDMAESIMQQIYEQSNSGRVIISRDR